MPQHSPVPNPPSRALNLRGRGHSPAAADIAGWCTDFGRLVDVARRRGPDGLEACALRGRLLADLVVLVQDHAPFELEVTPRTIFLEDEPMFAPNNANAPNEQHTPEHELPWILHRDGVRTLRFERGVDEREAAALLDAVLDAAPACSTHEDLVTMLWESGLDHLTVRTEEFGPVRVDPLLPRHESGPVAHVDDRPWPDAGLNDVKRLWTELAVDETASLSTFHAAWIAGRSVPFPAAAEAFVARMLIADPQPDLAEALAAAVVTWIATCVQRSDWQEAISANELLRRVDPDGRIGPEALAQAFLTLDLVAITERLDESDVREQSRLFAFAVRVGTPALPLLAAALGMSAKARIRAGISTALAYAFADDPEPLARLLGDPRWHFVRNIVFVLGQIGGAEVVPHLAAATRHADLRVRRAAIHALGQVPPTLRRDVLLDQLDRTDGRLISAALAMLSREPDPEVSAPLITRVLSPDFEHRPEDQKIALLFALADIGGDAAVPALEEILVRGGWFARRSPERTTAARALVRLASEAAQMALERGLQHRMDAVREACQEAVSQWGRI